MPINDQKLQAELGAMESVAIDPVLSPTNCPTCRSGVIEVPAAIVAGVIDVEL